VSFKRSFSQRKVYADPQPARGSRLVRGRIHHENIGYRRQHTLNKLMLLFSRPTERK
jgi:hypothetical protein